MKETPPQLKLAYEQINEFYADVLSERPAPMSDEVSAKFFLEQAMNNIDQASAAYNRHVRRMTAKQAKQAKEAK